MTKPLPYAGARALGTIEHLGETFRVVRSRYASGRLANGFALLHGMCAVADTTYSFRGDAAAAVEFFKLQLHAHFPSYGEAPEAARFVALNMRARLDAVKQAGGYVT